MHDALQAQAAAARAEAARLRAQHWDALAVPACAIAGLRTAAMVRCIPQASNGSSALLKAFCVAVRRRAHQQMAAGVSLAL